MTASKIEDFKPKHEYLVCFDSDGTVIDAMNVKHNKCHGAAFIEVWGLEEHQEEVHKIWNQINLNNRTRGVSRFLALVEILDRLNGKLLKAPDLEILRSFVQNSKKITDETIEQELKENKSEILSKTLVFSRLINEKIAKLSPEDKPPFEGAKEALEHASKGADIAIVSSSNQEALIKEWGYYDLLKYADVMTSLEMGSKTDCIAKLIRQGYEKTKILMVGDAMPDLNSAKNNGVFFYPILINHEKQSWDEFASVYFDAFIRGNYSKYQQAKIDEFDSNFGGI